MKNSSTLRTRCFALLVFLFAGTSFGLAQVDCLSGYSYLHAITVNNTTNSNALTNYEVLLTIDTQTLVSNGRMESDGRDMRFTAAGCCEILPHYIESGMNTSTTKVWVRVDSIPANGTKDISMAYGNPGATQGSDGEATFAFFDDFDGPSIKFAQNCGNSNYSLSGSNMALSWSSNGMLVSDSLFPMSEVYTAEMDVTAATGTWPGLYWARNTDGKAYAMLINTSQARIAVSGGGTGYCQGMNWASSLISYSSLVGLWSITWQATGNHFGEFPTIGTITSTNTTHARNSDLRLCIGGISSGSGSVNANWVRARKYTTPVPTHTMGSVAPFPTPQPVNAGTDTTTCPGQTVTFSASTHHSYQWSTGDTTQSIMVSTPGDYWVIGADSTGCGGIDTVALFNLPDPSPNFGPDTALCPAATWTLDAGVGMVSYNWSTGATSQMVTVSPGATFWADVVDGNGCTGSDTITISTIPGSQLVDLGPDTTDCGGANITLDAGPGFQFYNWSTGSSNQSIVVNTSGMYAVTVTDTVSCLASDTITVTITNAPTVTFSSNANLLVVNFTDATAGAASWSWDFGDGNTSTQQNPVHTYAVAGSYLVCLTVVDSNGCSGTSCDTLNVVAIGLADQLPGLTMYISPVPATDVLNVAITNEYPEAGNLLVTDLQGRLIEKIALEAAGQAEIRIDTREMASGVYFLRYQTSKGSMVRKFMVE